MQSAHPRYPDPAQWQVPAGLKPGDTIGVVSPASPVFHPIEVARAKTTVEQLGYRVRMGAHVGDSHRYLAGSDEARLDDLNTMLRDPDVRAIFALRGGYGSARIVLAADVDALRHDPRPFIGFSDITSLHLAFGFHAGVRTFYGPNFNVFGAPTPSVFSCTRLWRAITSKSPYGSIDLDPDDPFAWTVQGGQAEGPLVGGCLELVAGSLGTPYAPITHEAILFLEDVHVEPWHLDHLITQLRNAGLLQDARGIVIGQCADSEPKGSFPSGSLALEEILQELLGPLGIPVLYGLPIGHGKHLATLPIGARARLDADRKTLEVLEASVS